MELVRALAVLLKLVMFACLPPAWLQVGQYELELLRAELPPLQVGQYAELALEVLFPRAAPTPLLDVLNDPRCTWVCWADEKDVP